jgi:hypothetical protein
MEMSEGPSSYISSSSMSGKKSPICAGLPLSRGNQLPDFSRRLQLATKNYQQQLIHAFEM